MFFCTAGQDCPQLPRGTVAVWDTTVFRFAGQGRAGRFQWGVDVVLRECSHAGKILRRR